MPITIPIRIAWPCRQSGHQRDGAATREARLGAANPIVMVLSLPPRVAPAGDVARMSAAIFTLQYATAFVVPLIAGALWDASGKALFAFIPGIAAAAAMAWGAMSLRIPDRVQSAPS